LAPVSNHASPFDCEEPGPSKPSTFITKLFSPHGGACVTQISFLPS
jgi:hypothetical protein